MNVEDLNVEKIEEIMNTKKKKFFKKNRFINYFTM